MDAIVTQLIEKIKAWSPHEGPDRWDDATFDALARDLFARQFERNAPYRALCEGRGVRPHPALTASALPAVPTDAFKHVRLSCAAEPERVFLTSGTTQGVRGAHAIGELNVYRASLRAPFIRYMLPEAQPMRMLMLTPSDADMPESSLSFMLGELSRELGGAGSQFLVQRAEADAPLTFSLDQLAQALDDAVASDTPVAILGTAFALVELCDRASTSWALPAGSRIMETGGFKGRTREVSRDALYELFVTRLGVPLTHCVSEYSMTELCSQAYTDNLWRAHQDGATLDLSARRLRSPPWARALVVDPVTLAPIDAPHTRGLIRWIDLANHDSVLAVQTSDYGVLDADGGLSLLGRAPDSELRGCSLTVEELLEGARDV